MVARLQYFRLCLFEMYVNVVFVIRCLYSTVSLTLVKEQCFVRICLLYFFSGFYFDTVGCLFCSFALAPLLLVSL